MSESESEQLFQETKEQRYDRYKNQLWQAAAKGMFRGTLIALVSGYALSYKYNYGQNTAYFRNTYKVWWFVCWNIVGVTFATDTAKMSISRQAAIEDEIKRNKYYENEMDLMKKKGH
ncbi:hypothetical protein KGF56_004588 [Candida oxycetoniae]|uniref:Uncharacterized protein n=1 Tax=Candida oxycetoniae TaxID=497107 RepID=A0AAI9WW66_9ASCO|nr:uncharacterized protein KGF56_004588 [Candida oxycetoniae]KAI3402707.1 hypothetical protein KGF56_004588 [Candida oxycetoniae]